MKIAEQSANKEKPPSDESIKNTDNSQSVSKNKDEIKLEIRSAVSCGKHIRSTLLRVPPPSRVFIGRRFITARAILEVTNKFANSLFAKGRQKTAITRLNAAPADAVTNSSR